MLDALSAPVFVAQPGRTARPGRFIRRWASWLLLTGWIALPLLPAIGLGMSKLLGLGLF